MDSSSPTRPKQGRKRRRKTVTRRKRGECYIAMQFWELESPAFQALSADATRVYLFMRMRLSFDASNNGQLVYPLRDAQKALHSDWRRARNALAELEHYGFIKQRNAGVPGAALRLAAEWQLTAFPCGGQEAARDFMRWLGEVFEPPYRGRKDSVKKQLPTGNVQAQRRQRAGAYPPQAAQSESKSGQTAGTVQALQPDKRRQRAGTITDTRGGGPKRARASSTGKRESMAVRAGKPTLRVRVAQRLHSLEGEYTRQKLMADFAVGTGEAQRVLGQLCEQGLLEKVGHGRYRRAAGSGVLH